MLIFRKIWTTLCHSIVGYKSIIEINGKNTLMYEYKAGDKIVCIYDFKKQFNPDVFGLKVPEYRETYTVREIEAAYSDQLGTYSLGIRLVEIVNRQHYCIGPKGDKIWIEPLFTFGAFRPQVYESTMQLFYNILQNPNVHISGHSKLDVRYERPTIKKGKPSNEL